MQKDQTAMVDEELESELRKASKAMDDWRDRGLATSLKELEESFQVFATYHKLAKEYFTRREHKSQGRKSPWN